MRWSQTSSDLSGLSELPIISHPCSAFKISGGSNNSKLVCPEFTCLGGVLKHDDRCHPCEPFQPKSDICDLSPADSAAQCLLRSVPFGSSSCQACPAAYRTSQPTQTPIYILQDIKVTPQANQTMELPGPQRQVLHVDVG